jgi:hypothetical protein
MGSFFSLKHRNSCPSAIVSTYLFFQLLQGVNIAGKPDKR